MYEQIHTFWESEAIDGTHMIVLCYISKACAENHKKVQRVQFSHDERREHCSLWYAQQVDLDKHSFDNYRGVNS